MRDDEGEGEEVEGKRRPKRGKREVGPSGGRDEKRKRRQQGLELEILNDKATLSQLNERGDSI